MPTHWAVNMSNSTGAEQPESDKHMECIQSKLTPCFRLSLAWSATSDTITKAAATQTRKKEIYAQPKFNEDTLSVCESTTRAWYMTSSCSVYVSVCLWLLKIYHCYGSVYEYHRAPFCRFTLCVLVFFGIRREVVQIIWWRHKKQVKSWYSTLTDYLNTV